MSENQSRAEFFERHPRARAWAALDHATNAQKKITPGPVRVGKKQFEGKRALILGAGVAGLTTAYELLSQESGMTVTILEAQNRTGGRCLSLRTGDTLTEDECSQLFGSKPGETQVVRFDRPVGDSEPYLNAGPGRIPSSHKRLLGYLKRFGVAVEVYVMNSESNLVQKEGGPFDSKPMVYRQLNHNTRGWLAQMVFERAPELLGCAGIDIPADKRDERVLQLRELMISFGELNAEGKYVPTAGEEGMENARSRAGFDVLPGVEAGEIADAIDLDTLLESEFWKNTRFYQPVDFLWQPTLFQPVGGMDQVQHAFAQQVAALGGTVHLNSPVKSIDWDPEKKEFVVQVSLVGTEETREHRADYLFSNIAMPFLSRILSEGLQGKSGNGFSADFKAGLHAVYAAQFKDDGGKDDEGYVERFLACTTKVGWQANRDLWQGSPLEILHHDHHDADYLGTRESEVGVVPIFGGISWTDAEIQQIWYPSNAYHDEKGVLTGAYNFSDIAYRWGKKSVEERLDLAREDARRFGKAFGDGLEKGLAIAWQNMPHIKGGWAQWQALDDEAAAVEHFNHLAQGTAVTDSGGTTDGPVFFVVGDQLSSLPGWQEGAIASALNALSRMVRPDLEIPYLKSLPDTRLMVEGL